MNLRYLLSSVVVCAAVAVNAAEPLDFGEMKPEVVYDYALLSPVSGYYTPVESGVLKSYCTGDGIGLYSDADHQDEIFSQQNFYTAAGEKARVYSVEKGKTVYFYNPAPVAAGQFRFVVEKEQIEVGSIDPSPDHVLSISSSYTAELAFNLSVKVSKCKLEINDVSAELTPLVVDSRLSVNWFSTLRQWYRDGKIKEGDILTMTLTGIRDEYNASNRPDFGDGLGKLVLKYKMAAQPLELVSEKGTPNSGVYDFLSYYLPGSDKGIVSLVFNGDLDPACHPVAEIQYGDQNNIEAGLYFENPKLKIEGNTVTVDLQGVRRFPEDMVPGIEPQSSIALIISNIKSPDGQYVLTGHASSPFSFGYSYNLKTVSYSIAADWLPVAGSLINEGDNMEIWVLNGQQISFDSVDFSYVKAGVPAKVSVPYSALTVEKDEFSSDALLYYLAVPAFEADPDSEVTVTFGGLMCADGLDHSSDIFVRYRSASAGVDIVGGEDDSEVLYDLTGRRVMTPSKGIYIRNGRKVVVK